MVDDLEAPAQVSIQLGIPLVLVSDAVDIRVLSARSVSHGIYRVESIRGSRALLQRL